MYTIRTIEKNAADLPKNMAVVDSDSYENGLTAIANELAKPEINLVVWDNAGDLLPDTAKQSISDLLNNLPLQLAQTSIGINFNFLSRRTGERYIIEQWLEHRQKICDSFDKQWGLKRLEHRILTAYSGKLTGNTTSEMHKDYFPPETIRLSVNIRTPGTLFADEKDDCGVQLSYGVRRLKEEANTLWMAREWSIAAFGAEKSPTHANPSPDHYPLPPRHRALELLDLTGKKPFIDDPRLR